MLKTLNYNKKNSFRILEKFLNKRKLTQKNQASQVSKIINNVSIKGISILIINVTKKIAKICPKIAIHLIFIRLPSKIVFIKN